MLKMDCFRDIFNLKQRFITRRFFLASLSKPLFNSEKNDQRKHGNTIPQLCVRGQDKQTHYSSEKNTKCELTVSKQYFLCITVGCLTSCLYGLRHCYFMEQAGSSVPLHLKSDRLQPLAWIWVFFMVLKFCFGLLLFQHKHRM